MGGYWEREDLSLLAVFLLCHWSLWIGCYCIRWAKDKVGGGFLRDDGMGWDGMDDERTTLPLEGRKRDVYIYSCVSTSKHMENYYLAVHEVVTGDIGISIGTLCSRTTN